MNDADVTPQIQHIQVNYKSTVKFPVFLDISAPFLHFNSSKRKEFYLNLFSFGKISKINRKKLQLINHEDVIPHVFNTCVYKAPDTIVND